MNDMELVLKIHNSLIYMYHGHHEYKGGKVWHFSALKADYVKSQSLKGNT